MIDNLKDFFTQAKVAAESFNQWVERYVPKAQVDHICYKCGSVEEFEQLHRLFGFSSSFLYQSIISKRRIAIVKFLEPVPTILGDVWFLELSDQKPDGSQTSGFDHFEIYPTTGSVEQLAESLTVQDFLLEKIVRPHHATFDGQITDSLKIRLESEPLIDEIKRGEMV